MYNHGYVYDNNNVCISKAPIELMLLCIRLYYALAHYFTYISLHIVSRIVYENSKE